MARPERCGTEADYDTRWPYRVVLIGRNGADFPVKILINPDKKSDFHYRDLSEVGSAARCKLRPDPKPSRNQVSWLSVINCHSGQLSLQVDQVTTRPNFHN